MRITYRNRIRSASQFNQNGSYECDVCMYVT